MRILNSPQRGFGRRDLRAGRISAIAIAIVLAVLIGAMVALMPPGFVIRLLALPIFFGFIVIAWVMRSAKSGLPGQGTLLLLSATVALSVIWPRYIFFSVGGPFVNPLTLAIFLSVAVSFAWMAYSPGLNEKLGAIASGSGGVVWLIVAWLVWRLFTSLTGQYPEASTFEFMRDLVYTSSFFLFGLILATYPNGAQSLMRLLLACALLVTFIGCVEAVMERNYFLQFAAGRDSTAVNSTLKVLMVEKFRSGGYRAQSTFEHPIVFSQFIAAMVPIALYAVVYERKKAWRGIAVSFLLISVFALYKTGSRAGVASLASCIALMLVVGWSKMVSSRGYAKPLAFVALPVVFIGLALVYFVVQELAAGRNQVEASSSAVRLQMVSMGVKALAESPLLGFGYGSAVSKAGFFDRMSGSSTIDSLLLSVAVDSGYVGLFLFLIFVAMFVVRGSRAVLRLRGRESMRAAVLVSAMMAIFTTFITLSITSNMTLLWLVLTAALPVFVAEKTKPLVRS